MAKVHSEATDLLSAAYDASGLVEPVLADRAAAQNVTFVPSIFGHYEMSNRTGKANMPDRAGSSIQRESLQVVVLKGGGRNRS
jgi:hypothetical protein